jgi:hypothetical protein
MFFYDPNTYNSYLKNFYSPEFYIDSFQNTKKLVTDKVITDTTLNKAAHSYIEAQTAFAKVLVNNTLDISKLITDNLSDKLIKKTTKAKAE